MVKKTMADINLKINLEDKKINSNGTRSHITADLNQNNSNVAGILPNSSDRTIILGNSVSGSSHLDARSQFFTSNDANGNLSHMTSNGNDRLSSDIARKYPGRISPSGPTSAMQNSAKNSHQAEENNVKSAAAKTSNVHRTSEVSSSTAHSNQSNQTSLTIYRQRYDHADSNTSHAAISSRGHGDSSHATVSPRSRGGAGHRGASHSATTVRRRDEETARRITVRRNNTVSGVTKEAKEILKKYMEQRGVSQTDSSRSSSLGRQGLQYSGSGRQPPFSTIDENGTFLAAADSEAASSDLSSTWNSLELRREGSSRADTLDSSLGRNSSNQVKPAEKSGLERADSSHKRKPSTGLSSLADSSARGSLTPSDDEKGLPEQKKKPLFQRWKERLGASFRRKKRRQAVMNSSVDLEIENDGQTDSQKSKEGDGFRKPGKVRGGAGDQRAVSRGPSSSTSGSVPFETASEAGSHAGASAQGSKGSTGVLKRFRNSIRFRRRSSAGKTDDKGRESLHDRRPPHEGQPVMPAVRPSADRRDEVDMSPSGPEQSGRGSRSPETMDTGVQGRPASFGRALTVDGPDELDSPTDQLGAAGATRRQFSSLHLQHQTSKKFGDKSELEKDELYGHLASRLCAIGDGMVSNSPAILGGKCQSTIVEAEGLEVAENALRTGSAPPLSLISSGDGSELLVQLASSVTSVTFENFSRVVTEAVSVSGDNIAQQLAVLFRLTAITIEMAGGIGTEVASRMDALFERYFSVFYAPRVVEAGGWDSLVEDNFSGTEVD